MSVKVRMKTLAAGPDGVFQVGAVADLPLLRAKAMVEGGYAEYVGSGPSDERVKAAEEWTAPEQAPEAAVITPPEKTVMPKPQPRRRKR
jgi:hypothetical protein